MSGTNKLIQSTVAVSKGSESTLTSALMNANTDAKKSDLKKGKKQK